MKRNLKFLSLLLVLVMAAGVLAGCGAKEPANAAFVTMSDQAALATAKDGNYVAAVAIEVPKDGTTVGELAKTLHEKYYKDGASGYATATTEYGEGITKMWGVENGGSYGYYVNGTMGFSLADPVKPGDRVDFMVYKDAAGFSDLFTYINATADGTKVSAKVESLGFDTNFNPVMNPLAGAKIFYVDGKKLTDTGAGTGEDGTASFTLKAGTYRIVAMCDAALHSVTAQKLVVK